MNVADHPRFVTTILPALKNIGFLCCLSAVLTLGACAALPRGPLIMGRQADDVRTAFRDQRQNCPAGIDAEVSLNIPALNLPDIDGYLLTYAPGYLRFDGLTPLGLTANILTTNGRRYDYIVVQSQLAYGGTITGQKYIPPALAGEAACWLLGRPPVSRQLTVEEAADGNYWLGSALDGRVRSKILFSPALGQVQRYVAIAPGYKTLDVYYNYQSRGVGRQNPCQLPVEVRMRLGGHQIFNLKIKNPLAVKKLLKGRFKIKIPNNYKRINLH
ncbi:hypothetical protein MNBD_DELTA03-434 [hydrothermal vent metagenome]|uniref:Uncharacterized protein n=1 Tax=hydrothermal vent metagenome TaxID=652676 RepID=A0A3B0W9Q5_9ZZZZ